MTNPEHVDCPYPTQYRLLTAFHLRDALHLLKAADIYRVLKVRDQERLMSATAIIRAYQASEDFLELVRTIAIIAQKNVNQPGTHPMFDFIGDGLAHIRGIKERWQKCAELFSIDPSLKIDFGKSPFTEYTCLTRFRNNYLHANLVWLEENPTGQWVPVADPRLGPFPNDPTAVNADHARKALQIVGKVIQFGVDIFRPYVPDLIQEDGQLCLFEVFPDHSVEKRKFVDCLKEAGDLKLSDEVDIALPRSELQKRGYEVDKFSPPTADMVLMGMRFAERGYAWLTRVRGYRDPR